MRWIGSVVVVVLSVVGLVVFCLRGMVGEDVAVWSSLRWLSQSSRLRFVVGGRQCRRWGVHISAPFFRLAANGNVHFSSDAISVGQLVLFVFDELVLKFIPTSLVAGQV